MVATRECPGAASTPSPLLCRTIDKYGGLDGYLLGHSDEALDSDKGVQLKRQVQAALQQQRRQQPPATNQASFLPPLAAATAAGIASGVDGGSVA